MTVFRILHLSDAHIGNPKHALDSLEVFESLYDDIEREAAAQGPANLILFTGDIAWGEIPECPLVQQYRAASDFIVRVREASKTTRDCPLLITPGNHDIDRGMIGEDQIAWRDALAKLVGDEAEDAVYELMRDKRVMWHRMLERQAAWTGFAKTLVSNGLELADELNVTRVTLTHQNVTVAAVGLNSAWACSGEEDKGRLWVGRYQMQKAAELCKTADFSIAAAHHPVDWLHSTDKNKTKERLQTHFRMFFHGHEHDTWFEDSEGHALLSAGPCYEGSTKPNGYSWLSLDFNARRAELRLRKYEAKGRGGWVPNAIPGKTDENGVAPLQNVFANWQPKNMVAPTAAVRASATSTSPLQVPAAPSTTTFSFSAVSSFMDATNVLAEAFGFRWEPASFDHKNGIPLVYWPVRLRHPTPIHAAQCFAAAALQQRGAQICLFIDDLGTADYSLDEFLRTLCTWFERAAGDRAKLETTTFTTVLTAGGPAGGAAANPWPAIRKWLGDTHYLMDNILRISKLVPPSTHPDATMTLEALAKRRPRRLLTPALVWSCLLYLHSRRTEQPVVTLGGYDERSLWQAWHECAACDTARVGHLYVPQLSEVDSTHGTRAVHMARPDVSIDWNSKDDIKQALSAEFHPGKRDTQWYSEGRLIPWCLTVCAFLPRFVVQQDLTLLVGSQLVNSDTKLETVDPILLSQSLADELAKWLI
jgi:predicted MPP superfamily phosphohydrolase